MKSVNPWRAAWRAGWNAARQNLGAFAGVWLAAGAIVLSYYTWPRARENWESLAAWRNALGLVYSMVATSLFGGVLPLLFQLRQPRERARCTAGVWLFAVVFWAYKGVEVDLFYHFQAWLFGSGASFRVLAKKVFVDMFVYGPFWAVPSTAAAYVWKDAHFSFAGWRRLWGRHGYRDYGWPAQVSNWLIWLPAIPFVYALPPPLQVPLFNLVLFLFVLILTLVVRQAEPPRN